MRNVRYFGGIYASQADKGVTLTVRGSTSDSDD